MEFSPIDEAVKWLEKANAELEPELLSADAARATLARYARAEKLVSYGLAALAPKIDDASELARVAGTSVGRAKQTVETGKRLGDSGAVAGALREGDISLDQAAEIAKAEEARPGSAAELLDVAERESFHV